MRVCGVCVRLFCFHHPSVSFLFVFRCATQKYLRPPYTPPHSKQWRQAAKLALELKGPRRLLAVLTELMDAENGAANELPEVIGEICDMGEQEVGRLLRYEYLSSLAVSLH